VRGWLVICSLPKRFSIDEVDGTASILEDFAHVLPANLSVDDQGRVTRLRKFDGVILSTEGDHLIGAVEVSGCRWK
jgi:hypothetical protein